MKIRLLERLRKSLNLSQNEIAERLGISRPTYALIEKEEKDITLKQAKILSDLYNIPVDSLRTGQIQKVHTQDSVVSVLLPTAYGNLHFGVWNQERGAETVFLHTPQLDTTKPVLVRIHSECMTGDVFHSYRCDCGEQKDTSLRMIAESGNGIFIYLRQEGRGIGLHEKIKAYILQERGYDTHEANILLGHKPDYREYSWAKKTLEYLGIKNIRLLTNNPAKVADMARLGVTVTERVPLIIESNEHNRRYFETKKQKFKHFFGKEESSYFYQFSYVTSPEQIIEIGDFMKTMKKDPLLKICTGVYADTHTLHDQQTIKNIESIFKATELYEGFVPILHFTFRRSSDPIADLGLVRERMAFVQYIQLNDIPRNHLEILRYANQFFLVDMPLSNESFHLIKDQEFVDEILLNKSFILLDNSHGKGKQDTKTNIIQNINALLAVGINDIAIYGGFGPDNLSLYFEMREHYRINFSIDAETNLKTEGILDTEKVKKYLGELIGYRINNYVYFY